MIYHSGLGIQLVCYNLKMLDRKEVRFVKHSDPQDDNKEQQISETNSYLGRRQRSNCAHQIWELSLAKSWLDVFSASKHAIKK